MDNRPFVSQPPLRLKIHNRTIVHQNRRSNVRHGRMNPENQSISKTEKFHKHIQIILIYRVIHLFKVNLNIIHYLFFLFYQSTNLLTNNEHSKNCVPFINLYCSILTILLIIVANLISYNITMILYRTLIKLIGLS